LYPFAVERSAAPWKVQVRFGPSYDDVRIVLERGPVDPPSLCKIDQFPNFKLGREAGFYSAVRSRDRAVPAQWKRRVGAEELHAKERAASAGWKGPIWRR
jgi:hypothetical protein